MNRWIASLVSMLCLSLVVCDARAEAPKVDLVIGSQAMSLEQLAAADIAADLKKIYDAQVTISTRASDSAEARDLCGQARVIAHRPGECLQEMAEHQ